MIDEGIKKDSLGLSLINTSPVIPDKIFLFVVVILCGWLLL